MPTYTMKNKNTGKEITLICSIAERDNMIASGDWTQSLVTPNFVSQSGSTVSKTSGDWRDLLKRIDKTSGRGSKIKY